jgi:hypothetical protein
MNFLSARMQSEDGRSVVAVGSDLHPVGVRLSQLRLPAPEVTLGVRPEDVRVAPATAPGSVPAPVYVVEAMGH